LVSDIREEHKLGVLETRLLRTFALKREEAVDNNNNVRSYETTDPLSIE
jgi:hypothetical protein